MEKGKNSIQNNIEEILPLTPLQEGMLLNYMSFPQDKAYHIHFSVRILGKVDMDIFLRAWNLVAQHNEVLRSCFIYENIKKPVQVIKKENIFSLTVKYISNTDVDSIQKILSEDKKRSIDITTTPFHIILYKINEIQHILTILYHHILLDGWSLSLLLNEFFTAYHTLMSGNKWIPQKKCNLKAYVLLLQNINKKEQEDYWKNYLQDFGITSFYKPHLKQQFKKNREIYSHNFTVNQTTSIEFGQWCSERNTTLAALFYSAWGILLQKYCYSDDVLFGITLSGRSANIPNMEHTAGLFINTIPMRIKIRPQDTINDIVVQSDKDLKNIYEYAVTPLIDIKKYVGVNSFSKLFDSIVVIENYPIGLDLENNKNALRIGSFEICEKTEYDLVIQIIIKKTIEIKFQYNPDCFDDIVIKNMLEQYVMLLNIFVHSPYKKVAQVEMLNYKDKEWLYKNYNATNLQITHFENIIKSFERQVKQFPMDSAIESDNHVMTYDLLNKKANQLARLLLKNGLTTGMIVGIISERSAELVISIIAVLKAGGTYLYIDPSYPEERIQFIIDHSKLEILLVQGCSAKSFNFSGKIIDIDHSKNYDGNHSNLEGMVKPDDIAYVIYTSGSTGEPKGVEITYKNLSNYILWAAKTYLNYKKESIPLFTSLSFDLTVTSLFLPLICGGTIHIYKERNNIVLLKQILQENKVGLIKLTPSHLKIIKELNLHNEKIKKIIVGGEVLDTQLATDIYELFDKQVEIYNEYGPTETTVGCMIYQYHENLATYTVPIGKPAGNTQIYLLDRNLNPIPKLGSIGEICIAGDGVAHGYLHNDELTAEKFIQHPIFPTGKMYRSGDLATWLSDGNINFIGRIDHQVKLHGYRIELNDIETLLYDFPDIIDAAVVLKKHDEEVYLVAYYTSKNAINDTTIKNYFIKRAPPYMIPNHFIHLDEMPLKQSGKINYEELSLRKEWYEEKKDIVNSTIEDTLINIWKRVLGKEKINIHDDFFNQGGNSLLLIQMYNAIQKEFPDVIKIADLFSLSSISALTNWIILQQKNKKLSSSSNTQGKQLKKLDMNYQSAETADDCDIAVIGLSASLPQCEDADDFWEILKNGVDLTGEFPQSRRKDAEVYLNIKGLNRAVEYYPGAYLDDISGFDYDFFGLSPKEAELIDPNHRLFLEMAWKAIEDAGYGGAQLNGSNTGVYVGFSGNQEYKEIINTMDPTSAIESLTGNLDSFIGGRLSYILNLTGPNILINTACSSSLVAVHMACEAIKNKTCDMAITGSVNIRLVPLKYKEKLGIESTSNKTKTFNNDSDGTVIGEGAITLVLKSLSKAKEDGDHIIAVIKGSAINHDGHTNGMTAPSPEAQKDVIIQSWLNAGIDPATISYIEAHGTGTKLGDPVEIRGIEQAFRSYTDQYQFCAVGSVKTNIGHLDHAAGIVGLLKVLMSLKYKQLPASLYFTNPNRKIQFQKSPVYVNSVLSQWEAVNGIRRCGVSSFGISGTNCHLVLEEYIDNLSDRKKEDKIKILTLSAKSLNSLKNLLKKYIDYIIQYKKLNINDLCYTANTGRGHYNYRIAVLCNNLDDLGYKLGKIECMNFKIIDDDDIFININEDLRMNKTKDTKKISWKSMTEKDPLYAEIETVKQLAQLYVQGYDIDWGNFYKTKGLYQKMSLPTYPFDKKRCWVRKTAFHTIKQKIEDDEMFYVPLWEEYKADCNITKDDGITIIFMNSTEKAQAIVEKLKNEGPVIQVSMGSKFQSLEDSKYIIKNDLDDYIQLFKILAHKKITRIVHLFTLDVTADIASLNDLNQKQELGVISLFYIVKALLFTKVEYEFSLIVVTSLVNNVTGHESKLFPENATLIGLAKVINQEYNNFKCKYLDVDDSTTVENITDALWPDHNVYGNAFRDNILYQEKIKKTNLSNRVKKPVVFKEKGVYIITGGTGGIGLHLAKYLSSQKKVNIVLIHRSPILDRKYWDDPSFNKSDKLVNIIESVRTIEKNGSKVCLRRADISNPDDIENLLNTLRTTYGRINGIIHCAGVIGKGLLINENSDTLRDVLRPKVQGTWLIDHFCEKDELDFLILCSSTTSLTGAPGEGSYTAANNYLDAYAFQRSKTALKVMTINWTAWESTGMAFENRVDKEERLLGTISPSKALYAFDQLLHTAFNRIVVGGTIDTMNADSIKSGINIYEPINKFRNQRLRVKINGYSGIDECRMPILFGRVSNEYTETEKDIAYIWQEVLGHAQINVYDNFFDLGGNSLLMAKMHFLYKERMDWNIAFAELYKHLTISQLADYYELQQDISEAHRL